MLSQVAVSSVCNLIKKWQLTGMMYVRSKSSKPRKEELLIGLPERLIETSASLQKAIKKI